MTMSMMSKWEYTNTILPAARESTVHPEVLCQWEPGFPVPGLLLAFGWLQDVLLIHVHGVLIL